MIVRERRAVTTAWAASSMKCFAAEKKNYQSAYRFCLDMIVPDMVPVLRSSLLSRARSVPTNKAHEAHRNA